MENDIDSLLLQQFSSMATQDRDVLVAEFQRLLGNQVNDASSAFYLDMNNWNLQDAICSYFEYHSENSTPLLRLPQVTVVQEHGIDATSHDQAPTLVAPNASLSRVWNLMNSGSDAWPANCSLRHVAGHQLTATGQVMVDPLLPGNSTMVQLEMVSPPVCGVYREQWQMCTFTGTYFGDALWVVLHVIADDMISDMSPTATSISFDPTTGNAHIPTSLTSAPFGTSLAQLRVDELAMNAGSASSLPPSAITADTDNMDMS